MQYGSVPRFFEAARNYVKSLYEDKKHSKESIRSFLQNNPYVSGDFFINAGLIYDKTLQRASMNPEIKIGMSDQEIKAAHLARSSDMSSYYLGAFTGEDYEVRRLNIENDHELKQITGFLIRNDLFADLDNARIVQDGFFGDPKIFFSTKLYTKDTGTLIGFLNSNGFLSADGEMYEKIGAELFNMKSGL